VVDYRRGRSGTPTSYPDRGELREREIRGEAAVTLFIDAAAERLHAAAPVPARSRLAESA
jgi:hypothetical protein